MNTVKTDKIDNGHRPVVLYDGQCPVCCAAVARWGPVFEAHGLDFDTLQSPQSRAWLGLAEGELPPEMKIAFPDGSTLGGAIAIAYMLRKVWWMAWIGWLIPAPGIRWVSERVYRWLARNRGCLGDLCANRSRLAGLRRHHGATTFLEGP